MKMGCRQWICTTLVILATTLVPLVRTSAIAASTLDEVKARGKMIAGVRYDSPPFGSLDNSGKVVGFDIDLINDIAKRLGVGIELVQVTAKTRIPMLESGKIDVIAAVLTHTRERDRVIDFSISYLLDGQRLLVKKGSGIGGVGDLKGKTVSAVQGSYNEAIIRKIAPEARVLVFQEYPQAFLALKQGLADAFTTTATILEGVAKKDPDFELVGEFLTSEPIAFGMRENDSKWRDAINFALQDMVADGTYKATFDRYFTLPYHAPEMWAP
jgi:polar amino acid transport system substrate-binding protein